MPSRDDAQSALSLSRLTLALALVAAGLTTLAFARPVAEVEQHRRHLRELQHEIAAVTSTRPARLAERGQVLRLQAQARASSGAQRAAFETDAAKIANAVGWEDQAAVRAALLKTSVLTPNRNSAVVLHNTSPSASGPPAMPAPPAAAPPAAGCRACHLAVDTAGYEAYPQPLRTHPRLESYAGPDSPHAAERVQCTQCHEGLAETSTFEGARHARLQAPAATRSVRLWADPELPDSMLPLERTEASCSNCHAGEIYQPPAPRLNDALLTLDRGGCYSCHTVAALERAPKRGPDLRHIRQKLSPEWVRAWLADPRRVKPATWMPKFWRQAGTAELDNAAIAAVTEFLFSQNPTETQISAAVQGQVENGKSIVEKSGCLGCHVVGAVERDSVSQRRTFGQVLDGLGSKTTRGWLAAWVRDPTAMSPDTRMPRLRLSATESADVAAYLATLTSEPVSAPPVPDSDDVYRQALRRYGTSSSTVGVAAAASGRELRELTGRAVVESMGCPNCHEISGLERSRTLRVPISSRRIWRDSDARAIHSKSASAANANDASVPVLAPDYALGEQEANRVALALSVIAGPGGGGGATVTGRDNRLRASGRSLIQQRNCVGCHAIEGVGGDLVSLMPEPALGPPLLTPEGARVQPDWLRRFLNEPRTIRPWLSARMPTFGLFASDIDRVGDYLRLIAPENPQSEPATAETIAAGAQLFELLKCQQCHVLDAVPSDQPAANLAPDLRMAHDRLQPAWIQAWLQNPTAILPGTRMPSFWPQYPKSYYEPLDSDATAQIRAIRDHLLTLR